MKLLKLFENIFQIVSRNVDKDCVVFSQVEDRNLWDQLEQYNRHLHGIDDQQRHLQEQREQQAEVEAEVAEALLHFSGNMHNNHHK